MMDRDELVKKEILDEAQKLFRHFGWSKTTIEDIAKAAGKGKSTLYYYYKSKDEIFDAVVSREMDEVFRTLQEEVGKMQTAEDKLRTLCLTRFDILKKRANLYSVIKGDIEANIPRLRDLHKRYELREISLVRNILRFGLERKEFAQYAAEDIDAIAFAMVCAFRGLEVGLLVENKFAALEGRMDIIHNILMRGLKT
ncbi:TetR/AcrR family transcriptional regulator [Pontibacter sp. HSC-36F09]|uniref:TetR/AcrR family transcriptional regulator n=1 Tax=Pontibacter sp. HSC-36F09 TaxID=2910966 RepID=UPI0020A1B266|nr:TetR/AcrR family transcriptional regulator [Pontibacter sp. HSC-36F09]MCP2045371.1 AcrR family transcriptional regulator [Pontibacter sp. HSC-36F09]